MMWFDLITDILLPFIEIQYIIRTHAQVCQFCVNCSSQSLVHCLDNYPQLAMSALIRPLDRLQPIICRHLCLVKNCGGDR